MTKQYAASGLILLMAMPLFFSVGTLWLQRRVQQENEKRLETEILQTITISREDLHWVKPGKEVVLEGELFDVKSFSTEGDQVILTGFFDKKESELVSHLSGLTGQKDDWGIPVSHHAAKYIFFPVFTVSSGLTFNRSMPANSAIYHPYNERITGSPGTDLFQPPRS